MPAPATRHAPACLTALLWAAGQNSSCARPDLNPQAREAAGPYAIRSRRQSSAHLSPTGPQARGDLNAQRLTALDMEARQLLKATARRRFVEACQGHQSFTPAPHCGHGVRNRIQNFVALHVCSPVEVILQ